MGNQTDFSEFALSGFSDLLSLQTYLFLLFLFIYLMTLTWNLLIIVLILTDLHLHTPMYFFLGNLAFLDMGFSSVTSPQMLCDLYTQQWRISRTACITQVFFFLFFVSCEVFLLAVMSCDRYVAICRPLHYLLIMHWRICGKIASGVWGLGVIYSLVHTLCTLRLNFCGSDLIQSFFCDLPQLFKLSCTDTFINILVIFLLGGLTAFACLVTTFVPYMKIYNTVVSIQTKSSRLKAFSTCTSYLTVVFIFYGTLVFNYFRPNTSYHFAEDRVVSVIYTLMTPLLNPLIYSLRNQEIQAALRRELHKMTFISQLFHKNN
ncbi:olfactory receptor 1G1-like [Discoglossus pictus]